VREELRGLGFCLQPFLEITAAAVGAPFLGRRLFLLAAAHAQGESTRPINAEMAWVENAFGNWWDDLDRIRRLDDGIPGRMVERAAFGDAVVPLVAAHAFRTLAARAGLIRLA
jgi:hypothetical protein